MEKAKDFSLNSGKKEAPSEVELLQQVTADLKAELRSLKEQLEREKKTSSDVKSLKTQQICTLTFKLANAVRQRERAEEELVKIRKEMEELKEVVKSQEEELKGKDVEKVECDREVEKGAQDESIEKEIKEVEDVEEIFETKGEKSKESEKLKSGELTSDIEHSTGEEDVQQQFNKAGELEKVLEVEDNETGDLSIEIDQGMLDRDEALRLVLKELTADDNEFAFPSKGKDCSSSVTESSPMNENDSLCLKLVQNECDKLLPVKNSLLENSPPEETPLGFVPPPEISPLSSPNLSALEPWKENSSIQENREEIFHINDFQNSSSEKCVSSLATSFETCEEYTEDKDELIPNCNTQGESFSIDQSYHRVSNVEYSPMSFTEMKDKISERGDPRLARKNKRVFSQNSDDQESSSLSPLTSPGLASSGYVSNGTDGNLANLLMRYGMPENQSVEVGLGNYREAQEANPAERFLCEKDDVISESEKMQDNGTLKDFIIKDLATPVEKRSLRFKANAPGPDKDIRNWQEKQNDFTSQNMTEEVEDLKQNLTTALKEIEELRLDNREMKKEIMRLSNSAEENAFLVKTAQFTDRLLRQMREREAKVHATRIRSSAENHGLETDFSYSVNVEQSDQMMIDRNVRRREDLLNRSVRSKVSLPLKTIGEKLKEITRSVENMAMDPDLGGTLSATSERDFLDYDMQLYPNLNDRFEEGEQLIIPSHSSERVAAQSTSFRLEMPKETFPSGHTSVEKLGENNCHSPTDSQHEFSERDCARKEKTFHLDSHAQELSGFENCRDSRDYVQRYVVRSSENIAKLRDLKPEELAFYSKN